jgi:hypothetical protein
MHRSVRHTTLPGSVLGVDIGGSGNEHLDDAQVAGFCRMLSAGATFTTAAGSRCCRIYERRAPIPGGPESRPASLQEKGCVEERGKRRGGRRPRSDDDVQLRSCRLTGLGALRPLPFASHPASAEDWPVASAYLQSAACHLQLLDIARDRSNKQPLIQRRDSNEGLARMAA